MNKLELKVFYVLNCLFVSVIVSVIVSVFINQFYCIVNY
jgi:hypothetical protein